MRARAAGFGLIEVLITLLVFSIGILAVAGLQAVARKNNYEALQRTTAAWLAHSIIASMRANPQALDHYLVAASAPLGSGNNVALQTNCYDQACTPAQLANFDRWLWQRALDGASESVILNNAPIFTGGLSRPSACILGPPAGASGTYTVVIAWRGVAERGGSGVRNCGKGRSLYGAPQDSGTNANNESYQRALVVQTYIAAPS